jgi:hypothetical protein
MIAAFPSEGGIMGNNQDSLGRDMFSNFQVDDDSLLLLRGGNLHDGTEAQFQPDGPETVRPITLESLIVRGGSVAVLGHHTSKNLSETLANRLQMAKVKAKLPDQNC